MKILKARYFFIMYLRTILIFFTWFWLVFGAIPGSGSVSFKTDPDPDWIRPNDMDPTGSGSGSATLYIRNQSTKGRKKNAKNTGKKRSTCISPLKVKENRKFES